jgi:hypothetical protein
MTKNNDELTNEEFSELLENEANVLANVPKSEITSLMSYTNLWDLEEIKEIIPDFYNGRDLIGQLVAIHSYEWKESRQYADFIIAKCELPNSKELVAVGFFSIAVLTIFRGLDNVQVKFPFVVGIERANLTYTFVNPKTFIQARGF